MSEFAIEIGNRSNRKPFVIKVMDWLRERILIEKFNNLFGFLILLFVTICATIIVVKLGEKIGVVLSAVIIGLPMVIACLFNFKFGISFTIILAFFLLGLKRFVGDVQFGIMMDVLIGIMFFGLFIKQVKERDWSFAKNLISFMILVWILYNLLEFTNPSAESTLAWVYTVRSIAGIMILYFILMYAIKSKEFITWLIKLWIFLMALACLYGYIQEFFGFPQYEMNWIMKTQERYALLFQYGKFRKFSFFSDPLVFGISMSFTSILCFVLAGGPFKRSQKIILFLLGLFMINGMLYSGTRAAYVLPPAAFMFYTIITFRKRVLILAGVLIVLTIVLIRMPTGNPNLARFQSAFHPSDDPSYQVRVRNQAYIQPYIQTHPMGGGLGSVGEWGQKFSPESPLANFPPDSGFMRIAVEMGYIGLFLYCSLLFVVFYCGIKDYFRIKDPLLKTYSLGMLTVLYALTIANFPQEAIGQYPISLLFFVCIAIVNKCRQLDESCKTRIETKRIQGGQDV